MHCKEMKVVVVISEKKVRQQKERRIERTMNLHMYLAWELKGEHQWELHKEELNFEVAKPSQRYK